MNNYTSDYEKALKYSADTIKNLVSHEKPHETAHIIADAVEENNMPTVAKYLRMAGEDAHLHKQNYYPKMFGIGATDGHLGHFHHDSGTVLSGIRSKLIPLSRVRHITEPHLYNDIGVSHLMGDEDNNPSSYLNLTFKRHDGNWYHIKHSGQPQEHKEDLEKMTQEGVPGAEQALRSVNNVLGNY
jgi:hypothetical protein